MDKENGNRKRSAKGKVAIERVQIRKVKKRKKKGRTTGGIITGVKLGIKEKRQGKGEEEGYMERKVHIGNKWWKLTTNDSKKTCRRCNEIKEGRSFTLGTSTGE
jgi:hypothetical protein